MLLRMAVVGAVSVVASFVAVAPASAQRLVTCAGENGFCQVPYPTTVVYGVPGASTSRDVGGRGIPCTNRVFGDPAPGVVKRCAFIARGYEREHHREREYERGERRYDGRRGY